MAILDIKEKLRNLVDRVDGDLLRSGIEMLAHLVMDLEVAEKIGAERYERTHTRQDYRNGTRSRTWETRVGPVELHIPKLRHSGFQPSFLEPRKRGERALVSVVQEAYINGVSTRKVENLVRAMGLEKFDKSRVSRACAELSEQVDEWRGRPLTQPCPYMWVDAKYIHVRSGARVVKKAFVVAYAVREDGYREIIGCDVFACESEATWEAFLRALVGRGLHGVELVISDAHEGLKKAVGKVMLGASWQRCYVHFMRNLEGHLAKVDRPALKACSSGSSTRRATSRPARSCATPSSSSRRAIPTSPRCSTAPRPTCWPTPTSPELTGGRYARRTRSSGSTARSGGAPTWWGSSPTTPRWCGWSGWSSSSKTTSGASAGATSARARWRSSRRVSLRRSTALHPSWR